MTNKPMLSVERDLVERAVQAIINTSQMKPALNELRALLDSPSECRCRRYGKDNPHWPCPVHAEPAAQHQGEPVAWMFKYLSHGDSPPYRSFEVTDFHQNPKAPGIAQHTPLYAEQPAPVAVVAVTLNQVLAAYDYAEAHPHKYLRGTTNWCAAFAYKLNACLDEVTRLNTQVSAQTCCGSCPGGCTIGNKP